MAWRRGHRGRPRKAQAKRHTTTLVGRRPDTDLGSAMLRTRKRMITRREDLELTGAAVLYGHDLLDRTQYDTLGGVTEMLQRVARAWGGKDASLNGLWSAILAAASSPGFVPAPVGDGKSSLADQARRRLQRVCKRLNGSRDLVIGLAEGRTPDIVVRVLDRSLTMADAAALDRLRASLDDIGGERTRVRSSF